MVSKTEATQIQEFDVQAVLGIMDVVDTMRNLDKEVQEQLDRPKKIEALKTQLRERYTVSGIQVTDGQLDKAITDYFSRRWEFEEPGRKFSYKLAIAYVNRKWIATRIGIPVVAVAVAVPSGNFLIKAGIEAAKRAAERSVENSIESAYVSRKDLESEIDKVLSSPIVSRLPSYETEQVKSITANTRTQLTDITQFFNTFCPDGISDDTITLENYTDVEHNFNPVRERLNNVKIELDKARGILDTQERLESKKKSLDTLIEEIRTNNPPQILKQQAETLYAQGIASFEGRQLKGLESYVEQLSGKKADIAAFTELPTRLSSLYAAVKNLAQEDAAVAKAENIHDEAQTYIQTADIDRLRESIREFEALESALNQEYEVVIVGGDERYWKGDPNSPSVYYLKVEAHDQRGRELTIRIKDAEQDGKEESVTQWGEHVPQHVYERIKRDKLDDGIINNKNFGRKRKGYLTEEVIFADNGRPLQRSRQVTLREK